MNLANMSMLQKCPMLEAVSLCSLKNYAHTMPTSCLGMDALSQVVVVISAHAK